MSLPSPAPSDEKRLETHVEVATKKKQHLSAELTAALEATPLPRWSRAALKLYLSIFVALCCSYANGYDGSVMTALIAMDHFQRRFKSGTTGGKVGAIFGVYNAGCFVGGPFGAYTMDRFGRRAGMCAGSALIIAGSILTSTATELVQFIIGRFVLGFGIAFAQMAAPAYTMEVALPQWRGRCTGIYNVGWYGGAIPAAAITFGTNYINSHLSWQLPLIFQCFAAVLVLAFCPFIPESPRFLMSRGREDDARTFLAKYHGNGNPDAPLVKLELDEMRASLAATDPAPWWDYRPLFATKASRWRMAQVIMMSVFGQFSGNGLAYFATVIYANIGVTSTTAQLGYNLLYAAMCAVGALAGAALTDHMPRRMVLTFGTLLLAVILGVFTGLNAIIDKDLLRGVPMNEGVGKAAIAVYVLFGIACAFTYTPLQAVVPVEALSTAMRAKGLAVLNVGMQGMSFINMFAGPVGLGNIGYRYIFVFVVWDVVEAACWWFFGVEARGRTLEELDWIYEQPNPVKASKTL
ncbi:hypothetical protein Q8F55_000187 [Vanrija albida]|uniref:Major facilitator superfamily (MFS) profile domain-containing protein n=1 Tax=Vanrija albida TaxID=181172 RepID=A0ABR3QD51_9TREE